MTQTLITKACVAPSAMSEMDYPEYRDKVETLAQNAIDATEEFDQPLGDAVFENVDSSELVIYNHYHTDVLDLSDEGPQEWGAFVSDGDSWREVLQAMAFSALESDVWARVNELQQEA